MKRCENIAVIGAGVSGVLMGKALKEEEIEFTCYELSSDIGGTWCYREDNIGFARTTSTTTLNSSKEISAVSDHLFPAETPNFVRHQGVYQYIYDIAEAHDVLRHIKFNHEVVNIRRTSDYDVTGHWLVTLRNTETGKVTIQEHDGVAICTGHFSNPNIPQYEGMELFKGKILHSSGLKTFESFANQNVVVVGFGCSALDAAVEISRVAKQVYLSSRSHSWILPRAHIFGIPQDVIGYRRCINLWWDILPIRKISTLGHIFSSDLKLRHKLYGIHPAAPVLCREPVISDDIGHKLQSGSVVLKKNIEHISTDEVVFEEEKTPTKVDAIVLATGYNHDFSFLENEVLVESEPGKFNLYKCMYPQHLPHPSLVFIGFVLVWGPGFPVADLQSRWAAYIFSGKDALPEAKVMTKDIDKRFQKNVSRYTPSNKMSQRVDAASYCDDIASQFGVKPKLLKLAFTDVKLFLACLFGVQVSYQYRLRGPHKWSDARQAILKVHRRVKTGFGPNPQNL